MSPELQAQLQSVSAEVAAAKKKLADLYKQAAPMDVPDVELRDLGGAPIKLSSLFADQRDLIIVHNMGRSCRWCTLWADGFRGHADHIASRTAFALLTPDEPADAKAFAQSRAWNYPVACYGDSALAATLGFEPTPGQYYPGFSALHKADDGAITRTGMGIFGPGDDFCPVWPLVDQLKDGQNGWEPQYAYDTGGCCKKSGCGCS